MNQKIGKRKQRLFSASDSAMPPTGGGTPAGHFPEPKRGGRNAFVIILLILSGTVAFWWFRSGGKRSTELLTDSSAAAVTFQQGTSPSDSLVSKMENERVTVVFRFTALDESNYYETGGGFIIGGKYLATCYHLQAAYPYNITASYIIHFKSAVDDSYDSIPFDLTFDPKSNQYDFRKHEYDTGDRRTDFVLYKLKQEMPPNPIKFTQEIKLGDSVYAIANLPTSAQTYWNTKEILARGEYLFDLPEKTTSMDCRFRHIIGDFQSGFSGSPVYDKEGDILGIYLFEKDSTYPAHGNVVSRQAASDVAKGHAKGWNVGAFMPIDYIKKRYLTGYLKDSL